MEIHWKKFNSLRNAIPVVDVRSPKEFQKGRIPGSINIPLLSDQERAEIGKIYKRSGRYEAVKIALRRGAPRFEQLVVEAKEKSKNNKLLVYCWRGGMRSNVFCFLLEMAGIETYVLKGGYKTFRNEILKCFAYPFQFMLLSGNTGSGKSELIRAFKKKKYQGIDLEELANHKGSVFGGLGMPPQPTTEQFQNLLFDALMALDFSRTIWLEDESITIGNVSLPDNLWKTMRRSPVILMNVDKSIRIARLVEEYGKTEKEKFVEAIEKITKKLGNDNAKKAREKVYSNDMSGAIEILITCYYDKAYQHGLEKRNLNKFCTVEWNGDDVFRAIETITQSTQNYFKETFVP